MMRGHPAVLVGAPLQQREVGDPEELPALAHQAVRLGNVETQLPQYRGDQHGIDVGDQENGVAVLRPRQLEKLRLVFVVEVFGQRPLENPFLDLEERHVGRAQLLPRGGHVLALFARPRSAAGDGNRANHAAAGKQALKRRETAPLERRGDVPDLEGNAQVGLVAAEAAHCLLIAEATERRRDLDAEDLFPEADDVALKQFVHVFFGDETHLQIDLGELRLAVGAQILVAETFGDLIVAVHAGDHQNLLEQLRRLRQRVKRAGRDAAGHEVVARTFGRGLHQDRRFHLGEVAAVQVGARVLGHLVARAQVVLHALAAQVEITVGEAEVFVHVFRLVADLERDRRGGRQQQKVACHHLPAPGPHVGIDHAVGAHAYFSLHGDHIFAAQIAGVGVHLRVHLRRKNYLYAARLVPQLDENHAAMVAAIADPAVEHDLFADQFFTDQPAFDGSLPA